MSERPTVIPGKAGIQKFDFPGFRVALAIASLPGMTPKLFNGFRGHDTRSPRVNTALSVSTLMMRLDDLTKRHRLRMEEGGSARWAYFERFGERRLWDAVDERLARKAVNRLRLLKQKI